MSLDPSIACFDIGSTNFRYAVGSPDGTLTTDVRVEPTRVTELREQVLERLADLSERVGRIDAASLACAGPVDDGIVRQVAAPDGTVVRDVRLGPAIEERFDLPVTVENDCIAGVLAEWVYGAGKDHDSLVYLAMGTGIGAGVVDDGRVLRGTAGHAAEVGLLPVGSPDRESCGVPGAWEAYCSGRGIAGFAADRLEAESRETALPDPDAVTSRDVFEAAREGDVVADEYLDRVGRYNAAGLGAVINAYNPGLITIGGGVGRANFESILERAEPHLESFAVASLPSIEPTSLGDEIGLYGALAPYAKEGAIDAAAPVAVREQEQAP